MDDDLPIDMDMKFFTSSPSIYCLGNHFQKSCVSWAEIQIARGEGLRASEIRGEWLMTLFILSFYEYGLRSDSKISFRHSQLHAEDDTGLYAQRAAFHNTDGHPRSATPEDKLLPNRAMSLTYETGAMLVSPLLSSRKLNSYCKNAKIVEDTQWKK